MFLQACLPAVLAKEGRAADKEADEAEEEAFNAWLAGEDLI